MLIEEEVKGGSEVNPDALEGFIEEDVLVEEEVTILSSEDEESDEIDIAFLANDEGYW